MTFFLYCIWFHICIIVHSIYLFNGFLRPNIILFKRPAPKHRQYVAETRETKLNNERQRKNECHTSVRCPDVWRCWTGNFRAISLRSGLPNLFFVYLPTRSINMIRDGVYSGGLSWCFEIMKSGWFCSRCIGWPLILILSNGTLFPMLADFASEMVAKWFNWEVSFPCQRKVSFQTRALELKESFSLSIPFWTMTLN